MTHLTTEEASIVAAAQASEATVELLRFAREGAFSERAAFGDDVVAKLAGALSLAIGIDEKPVGNASYLDDEERALLANLQTSVEAFIAGWVG